MFVVWRETFFDRKNRMIVDIKELNKITETNNYFMLLQSDVINVVINFRYIFTINAIKYFHQFFVKIIDWYKLTVMLHWDQEQFNITFMKYKKISLYVQRQIDIIFKSIRKFVKIYINDIIVYFNILSEYFQYLRKVFTLCRKSEIRWVQSSSF